jgi:hypothetical protein
LVTTSHHVLSIGRCEHRSRSRRFLEPTACSTVCRGTGH